MKIRQVAQVSFYYKGGYSPVEGEHTDKMIHSRKAFYGLHKFPSSDLQNPDHLNHTISSYAQTVTALRLFHPLNFNFDSILFHE